MTGVWASSTVGGAPSMWAPVIVVALWHAGISTRSARAGHPRDRAGAWARCGCRASPGRRIGRKKGGARGGPGCEPSTRAIVPAPGAASLAGAARAIAVVVAAGQGVQLTGMGRQSERVGVGVTLLFGFTLLVSSREHVGTEFRSPVSVAQRESIFSMRFSFSCPPGKHGEERDSYIP